MLFLSTVTSLIPAPYRALVGIITVFAILGGSWGHGYWSGYNSSELNWKATHQEAINRAYAQAQKIAKEDAEITEYYEKWKTQYATKYEQVKVTDYISVDCSRCVINPVGLGLLNSARSSSMSITTSPPGKPDGGMSTPPASRHWFIPRSGAEPTPNVNGVPNMQGAPSAISREGQGTI